MDEIYLRLEKVFECIPSGEILDAKNKIAELESKMETLHNQSASSDSVPAHEYARLEQEMREYKILLHEKANDVSELQSRLLDKERENGKLEKDLAEKSSRLEMADLNLSQIRSASTPTSTEDRVKEKEEIIAKMETEKVEMKKREEELTLYIRQAGQDREQIIQQYTAYGQALASQITGLTDQLNAKTTEAANLVQRESELVKHVEGLESQLQTAIAAQKKDAAETAVVTTTAAGSDEELRQELAASKVIASDLEMRHKKVQEERDQLSAKDAERNDELNRLQVAVMEREAAIGDLETQVEMLKSSTQTIRHDDLVAACESDKVAASRAMAQNVKLKSQVEELQLEMIKLVSRPGRCSYIVRGMRLSSLVTSVPAGPCVTIVCRLSHHVTRVVNVFPFRRTVGPKS